ncbi:hypothetical protein BDZ85DRAFT_102846 [Elsinoe ampelina]|uniref:BTB domain-containing protein n=1 Tax=Elsinoe ampelina TaxID=302913 RepID=A0A6A6GFS4_9PEZI|nr:hypothetical protein BDZ85DRAFT_102846 [Elsinoe ampelina]
MASTNVTGQANEIATSWTLSTAVEKMTEASEVIMLKIGDYETSIHKSLLIHFSEYYRLTLCGPFLEATTQQVDPIDDLFDKASLQTFTGWIYTGETNLNAGIFSHLTAAFDLYLFADRYAIPALKKVLCRLLVITYDPKNISCQHYSRLPEAAVLKALDNLPESDDLCAAIVDICARLQISNGEASLTGYPEAFKRLVVKRKVELRVEATRLHGWRPDWDY